MMASLIHWKCFVWFYLLTQFSSLVSCAVSKNDEYLKPFVVNTIIRSSMLLPLFLHFVFCGSMEVTSGKPK